MFGEQVVVEQVAVDVGSGILESRTIRLPTPKTDPNRIQVIGRILHGELMACGRHCCMVAPLVVAEQHGGYLKRQPFYEGWRYYSFVPTYLRGQEFNSFFDFEHFGLYLINAMAKVAPALKQLIGLDRIICTHARIRSDYLVSLTWVPGQHDEIKAALHSSLTTAIR